MFETITVQMRNLRQEPIMFTNAGVQFTGEFLIVTNYENLVSPLKANIFKMNDVKEVIYGKVTQ